MMAFISPEDFGCTGNGIDDDTLGMQAALDAAMSVSSALVNRAGATYVCGPLTIGGGTTWDLRDSTIKAAGYLDPTQPQLTNKITTGAVDYTYDDDIRIFGGKFVCDVPGDRSAKYLSFLKCGGLLLEGVQVIGPKFIGIALGGCKAGRINGVTVTGTGRLAVTAEGGPAIWIGSLPDGSTSDDTVIDAPYIHDTNWSALYANGKGCRLILPRFRNVRESAIFANADSSGLQIVGGTIDGVTRKNISASGVEIGGVYHTISGGLVIKNTDNCAISLTDTQNVLVGQVSTINARRDPVTFAGGSHIGVSSHGAGCSTRTSSPREILITGHMAVDYSAPSNAAVSVGGMAGGAAIIGLSILGNHYGSTGFSSGAIVITPAYWNNSTCRHANNTGAGD